ncbi:hypothetical protein HK100_009895 [Physocladia obscura]|uniref:N-acetyltransferase domain-containing protein n=1 Tax=Physocladia obscura TaxID=109957 RepID=A0AAD5T3R7_9FUNG|nr:hypothetical protein HK100_009895 [Physocladia obscura]
MIRAASVEDIPALQSLSSGDIWNPRMPLDWYTARINDSSIAPKILVWQDEQGSPIGEMMISLRPPPYLRFPQDADDGMLYLANLRVQESQRRRGVGSELVKELVKMGKEIGRGIRLECDGKKDNLIAWYGKFGFEVVEYQGNIEEYKVCGQVVMEIL